MTIRRKERPSGWISFAILCLILSVFLAGGCGGGDEDPAVEGPAIRKAYYIGNVREGLAPYLQRRCISFLPYDGESTDGPLFVSYRTGFTPDDGDIVSMNRVYDAGRFIVLVHATIDQVNEFLGHIGLPPHFDIEDGNGERKLVEIFAMNRRLRDDGGSDIFTWVTPKFTAPTVSDRAERMDSDDLLAEPPLPENDFDLEEFNETRSRNFVQYVADEEKRLEEIESGRESAKAAVASATNDLTQIAQAQLETFDVSKPKQHLRLNYNIYACHSYNTADGVDYDWFVVQQRATLNPENNYKNNVHTDKYLAQIYGYMVYYDFENWLEHSNSDTMVQLMNSSPASTSGSTSTTSGFTWNLGGNVGLNAAGPSIGLSGGVSFSSSEMVAVADCTVTNRSGPSDKKTATRWNYAFPRPSILPTGGNPFDIGDFRDAARLSRSNFEPFNQWLWKIPPHARDQIKGFKSTFSWVNGNSYGNQLVWWVEAIKVRHEDWQSDTRTFTIPFIYAPLIAGNGVDFSAKGDHKRLEFGTARSWTAESDQDWCDLSHYNGGPNDTGDVFVTVDPNDTGEDRWANITLRTTDGKGEYTVKVFQSRY